MRTCILLLVLCATVTGFGQYGDVIRTGRPGQSIGAFCVGKRVLQIQSGFTFGKEAINRYSIKQVVRYGITKRFELGAATNYSSLGFENYGFETTLLNARFHLTDEKKYIPSMGIQYGVSLPIKSEIFDQNSAGYRLTYVLSKKIKKTWMFLSNFGLSGENYQAGNLFYSAAIIKSVPGYCLFFIEQYANLANQNKRYGLNYGLGYFLNKDLQLDLYSGYNSLNQSNKGLFISAGISWRMRFLKNNVHE